jgi:hypothetical protein
MRMIPDETVRFGSRFLAARIGRSRARGQPDSSLFTILEEEPEIKVREFPPGRSVPNRRIRRVANRFFEPIFASKFDGIGARGFREVLLFGG